MNTFGPDKERKKNPLVLRKASHGFKRKYVNIKKILKKKRKKRFVCVFQRPGV